MKTFLLVILVAMAGSASAIELHSPDFYKRLGVKQRAQDDQIRSAYRALAKRYHPDINKAPDAESKFRLINEAYEALRDPARRKAHDQHLGIKPDLRAQTKGYVKPPKDSENTDSARRAELDPDVREIYDFHWHQFKTQLEDKAKAKIAPYANPIGFFYQMFADAGHWKYDGLDATDSVSSIALRNEATGAVDEAYRAAVDDYFTELVTYHYGESSAKIALLLLTKTRTQVLQYIFENNYATGEEEGLSADIIHSMQSVPSAHAVAVVALARRMRSQTDIYGAEMQQLEQQYAPLIPGPQVEKRPSFFKMCADFLKR